MHFFLNILTSLNLECVFQTMSSYSCCQLDVSHNIGVMACACTNIKCRNIRIQKKLPETKGEIFLIPTIKLTVDGIRNMTNRKLWATFMKQDYITNLPEQLFFCDFKKVNLATPIILLSTNNYIAWIKHKTDNSELKSIQKKQTSSVQKFIE